MQHLRQVPTTSAPVRAAGLGRPGFPHKSTFVNLMLDKKAKPNQMCVKILSYFRLENYKMYERVSLLSSFVCGKLRGKCGNPPQKQAPALDFCTFSTEFSTCGKNTPLLRAVYKAVCGKLSAMGKQTDNGRTLWQHYSTSGQGGGAKIPAKKKPHFSGNKRQLMLYFKMT